MQCVFIIFYKVDEMKAGWTAINDFVTKEANLNVFLNVIRLDIKLSFSAKTIRKF